MPEYGVSERETFSKIYAPGLFVIDDGFRCPGKNDLPLHHEVGPIANRQCFTDIVVRDENSDPAITHTSAISASRSPHSPTGVA